MGTRLKNYQDTIRNEVNFVVSPSLSWGFVANAFRTLFLKQITDYVMILLECKLYAHLNTEERCVAFKKRNVLPPNAC